MVCPSCNTPNRDDAKFCKSCGQPLHVQQAKASEVTVVDQVPAGPVPADEHAAAPAQGNGEVPELVPPQDVEDVSMAPTLILTPEKMIAYRSHLWQQELEREGQDAAATMAGDQSARGTDIADAPTILSAPAHNEQAQDIADMPTVWMNPATANDEKPASPPPAAEDEAPTAPSETSGTEEAVSANDNQTAATEIAAEPEKSEAMQTPPDQPEAAASTGDFAVLPVGTNVIGRYEITQITSENQQEHVYQVIDHQGYQHCWNCGSEQNTEGDEFCIDCGASMLNVPYIMHEYSAEESSQGAEENAEVAHVLQGTIVNTFIEQGHTYVIELPQAAQSPFPNGVQLLAASHSDAGDVRRSEPNEDSTLVLLLQRVHESVSVPVGVFIVADGLGGHDSGQVASRTTINIIAERMVRELLEEPLRAEKEGESAKPTDEDGLIAMFHGSIEDANTVLCQKNQLDKTDMGSTITGFMVVGEHAYIINVGDSRTYMMRGKQLYQLTTDHSLVGQLVAGGLIEPDDVYTHPQRSQIYRSLGDKPNVQIDVFKQQLHPGDILLSCSDGLWEMVRNPQIESILGNAPDPQTACAQLIEAANTNGGEDNISAVAVFVR